MTQKYPTEIEELFTRFQHGFFKEIDTPESWYPHIIKCHQELTEVDPLYTIAQIKEKFNMLRYYISASNPELIPRLKEITSRYEQESFSWGKE